MADGGATLYIAYVAMAAGTAVTAYDTVQANRQRQAILEQELRSNELAALDEENQRLIALREANEEMLARAGGVEAYASPSLIAAREFNFKMTHEDIGNIRLNMLDARATISAKISMLKRNSRMTIAKGIFDIAALGAQAKYKNDLLAKNVGDTGGERLKTGILGGRGDPI